MTGQALKATIEHDHACVRGGKEGFFNMATYAASPYRHSQ